MSARTASPVVIGLLAVISCLLTAYVIPVPVWVVFVGWASLFAAGGGQAGFVRSVLMSLVGVVVAFLVLLVVQPFGGSPWSVAVAVGLGAAVLVALGGIKALNFTPAGFLGFASTFGVLAGGGSVLDPVSFSHPIVQVVVALVIGGLFGVVSGVLISALTSKAPLAAVSAAAE